MKKHFYLSSTLLTSVTLASQAMSYGQTSAPDAWSQIETANGKIQASDVIWRSVLTERSHEPLTAEKTREILARSKAKAEQDGLTGQELADAVQLTKDTLATRETGQRINSDLHFVRVGNTLKVDINWGDTKDRGIEYFDGRNGLFLETMVKGEKSKLVAYINPEARYILSHSAPNYQAARFLTGMPLAEQYSPLNPSFDNSNSSVNMEEGKISVERRVAPGQAGVAQEYPALLRLNLSKDYLPVSYEDRNTIGKDASGGLLGTVAISDYKQYGSGIKFPSKVVIDTGVYKVEYYLQSAKFNGQVDPSQLKLPAGTFVVDSRFGRGPDTVTYSMKDGKPFSDTQVRRLLGEKPKKIAELQKAHVAGLTPVSSSSKVPLMPLVVGVFMLMAGVALWRKVD